MVDTQPHGTGDVNQHINPEYDPDEDGLVELLELDRDLTTDGGTVVYDYTGGIVPDAVIPDVETLSYTNAFAQAQVPDLVDHAVAYTPTNLSGVTGAYDGQVRIDDGTNTAARGTQCVWDDVNAVWRPSDAPSAGAFS